MPVVAAPPPPAPAAIVAAPRAGDPLRGAQAFLPQINWAPPSGGTGRRPLVAVLDTGVDARSPDLRPAVVAGARSFTADRSDPFVDREGHGTHIAGIIAATSGNGVGVSGVSSAGLLVVKVADSTGQAGTSSLVRGIRYATARGARIINVSFGGGGFSPLEQEAIDAAARRGVLVVASAGNGGGASREYPGAYRHVLAVAAVDGAGVPLPSSTSGPQIAIAAPGSGVLSTLPGGQYGQLSGTSMASAVVAGVAARVWSSRPGLDASQVAQILVGSARDVAGPGRDDATGAGVVDMAAALRARTPLPDTAEPNDEPRQALRTRPVLVGAGPAEAQIRARLTGWSDPRDGFRVVLAAGETLTAELEGPPGADLDLRLWRPRTPSVRTSPAFSRAWLAAASLGPGASERLVFTAARAGVYTIEAAAVRGGGEYRLRVARNTAP